MTDSIAEILAVRGKSHGEFRDHARCSQALKDIVRDELERRHGRDQPALEPMAMEAIDMVLHKIARVLAGEWAFADHWDDIAGYAKLVADRVR